jgi:hypothetical protein
MMGVREPPPTRAIKGVFEIMFSFIGFNTSGCYAIDPLYTPELIYGLKTSMVSVAGSPQ